MARSNFLAVALGRPPSDGVWKRHFLAVALGRPPWPTIGLLTACFFWAVSFIATKTALESAPPLTVVMLRLAISALCFLPWLALRGFPIGIFDRRTVWKVFVLSLFGTGLHYGTQTFGLQFTTAANASLYAVTGPISISLIAALFLGERMTRRKGAGIALALAGVLTVMGLGSLRSVDLRSHITGDFLVFFSIFLWALFTVFGKKETDRMGAVELVGAVTVVGAVWMLPVGLLEMHVKGFAFADISLGAWAAIGFLGVTCSFLATVLYFFALEKSESQKVGVYLYTVPPMTYAAAAVFLDERIGFSLIAGSILVCAGVYLTERG